MKSNNQILPEAKDINRFSLSLMSSKGILVYRYLYHRLFSKLYRLGAKVTFKDGITIQNGEYISIGNRVYLEKNVTLKFLEEFKDNGYKIPNLRIEDGVFIGAGTIIAAAKFIHIEKNVLIGPYCFIGDHDHEYRNISIPIRDQGYKNVKNIVIGEGSWVAAGVTVCSGVTIGKNSLVGANSVVTTDIPSFSLAVGNPAKVVKKFNKATNKWKKTK